MKRSIGIMQPYFFPYVGYFSLIKHTGRFILFDPVQFIRHGWIERNRVLKQGEGWIYVKAPLLPHDRTALIKDIRVDNDQKWQAKMLSQLETYKRSAPYYKEVVGLLKDVFSTEYGDITSLNKAALLAVCDYLGIDAKIEVFSEMGINIEEPHEPDDWALNICRALGDIDEYWNPPGGKTFFNPKKYSDAGIDLKFQAVKLTEYDQKREEFIPGLSILDVMMFNSPAEINKMLDDYELT